MLQLAYFKTSTTGNSAMSAAYSKNIQTVSFFVWKRSELRDTTVCFLTTLSVSFGSTARFFHSDSTLSRCMPLIHLETEGNDKIPIAYTWNKDNLISNLALDSLQKSCKGRLFKLKGVVRHWNRLPREAVDAPSLSAFKARLDGALSNLA